MPINGDFRVEGMAVTLQLIFLPFLNNRLAVYKW